jgi:hypothetical protein
MFFKRPIDRVSRTEPMPIGIPSLYPNLDPFQLEQFLTNQDYDQIKSFENIYILPFISQTSEPEQTCFGLGLSVADDS